MLLIQSSPGTALNPLDEAQLATLSKGVMEGGDLCKIVTKVIILNFNFFIPVLVFSLLFYNFFYFLLFFSSLFFFDCVCIEAVICNLQDYERSLLGSICLTPPLPLPLLKKRKFKGEH